MGKVVRIRRYKKFFEGTRMAISEKLLVVLVVFVSWFGVGMNDKILAGQAEKSLTKVVETKVEGKYLLYLPAGYEKGSEKKWPLVMFLHGAGERGDDLNLVKIHGPAEMVEKGKEFPVQIDKSEAVLDILLENLGYINFGPAIGNECKGIAGIMIDNQYQNTFECRSLPMQDISGLKFEPFRKLPENTPSFHRAFLEIGETADSFLRFPGRKGIAWINGFCLGRYWDIGPGDALYVPAPVLKKGKNEIIVFELYGLAGDHFEFLSERHFEALVSSPF